MSKAILSILLVLLVLASYSASAQEISTADNTGAKRTPETQRMAASVDSSIRKVGTASIESPVSTEHAVQIVAENGDSDAAIKISTPKWHDNTGAHYFSAILKSPLAKKGRTTLLSPDGVPDSTSVELKFTRWRILGAKGADNVLLDKCEQVYKPMFIQLGKKAEEFNCGTDSVQELLAGNKISEEEYEAFRRSFLPAPYAGAISWGASGKIGYQDFEYYDGATLSKSEERKRNRGGSIYVGYVPAFSATAYTATFSVQRAHKEADSQVACLPSTTGPVLTCVNGALAEPKRTLKRVLSLEYRRAIHKDIAIAVQISRDFVGKVNAIDIPVYLMSDGKAGLSGGFSIGYSSDNDKLQIGVFVTQPFSLFN